MTTERFAALAATDPLAAEAVIKSIQKKLWTPHSGGQARVIDSEARFRILRAGRRWGKTQLAAHEIIMRAVAKPGAMIWWVSQSDKTVRRGYRAVLKQLPRELLRKDPPSERANDRILDFVNGTTVEFYTAGTPDALAGEGVDFLVVDEAALIQEDVWFQLLRPTLSDTQGDALIISTPRGRNWFWKLALRGDDPANRMYESFHFVSTDSPFMDQEEVDDAQDTLPDLLFRQEYLAEFLQNAASIFTIDDDNVKGLSEPEGHVVLGIDLAKKADWTVISGCNAETRMPCVYERMNQTSWPIIEEFIKDLHDSLLRDPNVTNVTVAIDSTGLGDVVHDHLDDMGMDVVPVNFGSGLQKERMVRLLAAELEHHRAFIVPEMVEEFEHYEYEIMPATGRYKFEASIGHDDMVSAKMLEMWAIVHEAPPDVRVWDPPDELSPEERAIQAVRELAPPDSTAQIMANPAAWTSHRG